MSWSVKIPVEPRKTHDCVLPADPRSEGANVGSVWHCDECERDWQFDGDAGFDVSVNRMTPAWVEVPSGASDPAEMWSSLLVNLDER